jgi:hypothetical protein
LTPPSNNNRSIALQGLGVSRRFVEERIRDRVLKEGRESGTLEVVDGKMEKFLWEGNDVKGK